MTIISFVGRCMGNYSTLSTVTFIPQSIHKYICAILRISLCVTSITIHIIIQIGSTPLIIASLNGHTDVVHALIDGGADVNQSSKV